MYGEEEDKREDTKKLGIGKVFLMRIQQLLYDANNCTNYGDYNGWRSNLDCIFRKCSGRLTTEEKTISLDVIKKVDSLTIYHSIRLAKDSKGTKGSHKKTINVGKELTTALSEYEMLIIKILDRLNWLIPAEKKTRKPQ